VIGKKILLVLFVISGFSLPLYAYEEDGSYNPSKKNKGSEKTSGKANRIFAQDEEDSSSAEPEYFEDDSDVPVKNSRDTYRRDEPAEHPIGVSGGVGMSGGSFSAQVTVSYGLVSWASIDTTGFYSRYTSKDFDGSNFGPEIDLVLKLPNPTPLTPFIGGGPGYEKWNRKYMGETYEDASSMTANYFFGLTIGFTKHFGLFLRRKYKQYVSEPPYDFTSDKNTREKNPVMTDEVGFQFMF